MHMYDKRYNVFADMVSHYTNDPREALRIYDSAKDTTRHPPFITEGYSEDRDVFSGSEFMGVEITRRTSGSLTREQLVRRIIADDYRLQHACVQEMIDNLRQ